MLCLTASSAMNELILQLLMLMIFMGQIPLRLAYEFLTNGHQEPSEHSLIGYKLINTMSDYGSVSRGVCEVDSRELYYFYC